METNKKAFLMYCDLISVVEKLINKDREDNTNNAGELFYHILEYVNDRDPKPVNFLVDMAFEPIKLQLKRDYGKYESICERNRMNGKKGGRPKNPKEPKKPSGLFGNPEKPKKPDTDTDTDTDKDKDIILKENIIKEKTPKELEFERFNDWIKDNAPYIRKIKNQITLDQYIKLTEKYNGDQIRSVLSDLSNYKEAPKKYVSVYATFCKWAKKAFGN